MKRAFFLPSLAAFGLLALAPLAAAEPTYHVIQKGETLYSVARKYQLPYELIARANGISDPSHLVAGQRLLIPNLHKVEKGETLFGIAREYGVSLDALKSANKLGASAVIKPGEILVIPSQNLPGKAAGAGTASAGTASVATKAPAPTAPQATTQALPSRSAGSADGAVSSVSPLATSARPVDQKLSWPCKGEAQYLEGKLFGVLIRARPGDPQRAVASGTVVSAGPYRGFGLVAFVQSKTGLIYVYGGNDELGVKVGDTVRPGRELGRLGVDQKEGRALAYFFVFKDGVALDPAKAPRE